MKDIFKIIVCPVDLEAPSSVALGMADRLAQQNRATVCLVHAITPPLQGAAEPSPEWESIVKGRLEKIAREHFGNTVHCDIRIVRGEASSGVIRAAEEVGADLIVMATHRYTGLDRVLLGSVAEVVVRESPIPVLTVGPKRKP